MTDKDYFERHFADTGQEDQEERLNDAIPEGALIKMLAKEKRDLQLENLDLKRQIAILKKDNEALTVYCNKLATNASLKNMSKLATNANLKDMSKLINGMTNLWSQISKRIEPIKDLCVKTDNLKEALMSFVEQCEKSEKEQQQFGDS